MSKNAVDAEGNKTSKNKDLMTKERWKKIKSMPSVIIRKRGTNSFELLSKMRRGRNKTKIESVKVKVKL